MLISRKIPHLLGGVSQYPADLRADSHVADLVNAVIDPALGIVRRPPAGMTALLGFTPAGDVLTHDFTIGGTRYLLIVADGVPRVFMADGSGESPVLTPEGTAYLAGSLRAASSPDGIVIVNRDVTVAATGDTAPAQVNEAVVWVRSGNFGTTYTVRLGGTSVNYTTPSGTDPSTVTTRAITQGLITALRGSALGGFTFTEYGSSIHIARGDGAGFFLTTSDGRGDSALTLITDKVRSAGELPPVARPGMTVKVTGDVLSGSDDYYLRYTEETVGTGQWLECAAPGIQTSLDAATMPWLLAPGGTVSDLGEHTYSAQPTAAVAPTGAHLDVQFPTAVYPSGGTARITVDGVTFTHTVTDADTNDSIADALRASIDAHADFFASDSGLAPGALRVSRTTGSMTIASGSARVSVDGLTFFNPDLDLVPAGWVGYTLQNDDDGTTGVITQNTKNTVRVASGAIMRLGNRYSIQQGSEGNFVLRKMAWAPRSAGDNRTVPFPSFVGHTLDEVFHYQGRLGLTAGQNIVLSAAGDATRFFRQSAKALVADDVIDVRTTSREAKRYHSVVPWGSGLFLFTERGPHVLTGSPVLTPTTVRIDPALSLATAPVRPVRVGDSMFSLRAAAGFTRVTEMLVAPGAETRPTSRDITDGVASYLVGAPLWMVADEASSTLFIRTDAAEDTLYVYTFRPTGDGQMMGAWGRWVSPGAVFHGATVADGRLNLVTTRGANGTMVESIDLASVRTPGYLDEQTVQSYESDYGMRVVLHPFVVRTREGAVDYEGRLTVRVLDVLTGPASECGVDVLHSGRTPATTTATDGQPARVPVFAPADEPTITIRSLGMEPLSITALSWVGTFAKRARSF